MISNFEESNKFNVAAFLMTVLVIAIVVWLFTPPKNKLVQLCYWGNNAKMAIAQIRKDNYLESVCHRNNAIYIAKLYPEGNNKALEEMDKAIEVLPPNAGEEPLKNLLRDRAQIYMYIGDYEKAFDDYMKGAQLTFNDYIKVAQLYEYKGDYKNALKICKTILDTQATAHSGFACLADVYEKTGNLDNAIYAWSLAIDRKGNNPKAYFYRAKLQKKKGDMNAYNADMKKAKELLPSMDFDETVVDEVLNPKILTIQVQ